MSIVNIKRYGQTNTEDIGTILGLISLTEVNNDVCRVPGIQLPFAVCFVCLSLSRRNFKFTLLGALHG